MSEKEKAWQLRGDQEIQRITRLNTCPVKRGKSQVTLCLRVHSSPVIKVSAFSQSQS